MRKSFLFYPNWCRVTESSFLGHESSQVIENRAAVATYPELKSVALYGTCRALMGSSLRREWSPPTERGFISWNKISTSFIQVCLLLRKAASRNYHFSLPAALA